MSASTSTGTAAPPSAPDSYGVTPDFGTLYDNVPAYAARTDVGFYVDAARQGAGPVLELGCGTGRISLPIARAGIAVTGLDGSAEMLARFREKLSAEPADVRDRITLHTGDARAFALGAMFPLVIAPFRILQHLITIEDQLRCLESVARHLAPGGRFVFDVFNPSFRLMTMDRSVEFEETPLFALPDGRSMRRALRIPSVRWLEQVSESEIIYYVYDPPAAEPVRHVQAFDMRWYLRDELVHLLARAGFTVRDIFGNFDRSPVRDDSPEMVVVAERA